MELATVLGALGILSNTLWPLLKRRQFLLIGQVIAALFMCIHFSLLNAYTGSVVRECK